MFISNYKKNYPFYHVRCEFETFIKKHNIVHKKTVKLKLYADVPIVTYIFDISVRGTTYKQVNGGKSQTLVSSHLHLI